MSGVRAPLGRKVSNEPRVMFHVFHAERLETNRWAHACLGEVKRQKESRKEHQKRPAGPVTEVSDGAAASIPAA